jgi:transcriptional regulator with XRE-family HTH domain
MREVRRLRQEKGWNQTELAFYAGLAPSVISEIETGKRSPSAGTLQKLANALGVDVPDLFERTQDLKAQAPLPFEDASAALPAAEGRVDYRKLYFERRREHLDLIKEIIDEAAEVMGTEVYEEFVKLSSHEQHWRIGFAEDLLKLAHESLEHFDEDDLPEEVEDKVIHLRNTVELFKKSA